MKTPTSFTRADRRAILILSVIGVMCVVGIILFGTDHTTQTDQTPNSQQQISEVPKSQNSEASSTPNSYLLTPNSFDPNTVDSSTLVSLGISPRRVHTFMRYRSAGAVFREPKDIARCYSFSDEDIDRLLPLIHISSKYKHQGEYHRDKYPIEKKEGVSKTSNFPLPTSHSYSSNKFTSLTPVNINTADTSLLKRIPGVGEVIASMIVGLREKLGGFTSVSQLGQIRQISPELMEWFKVESDDELRKININTASFKALVSHPYISREQANAILHYIRLYGRIPDAETLLQADIFTPDQLSQLLPYLQF